MKATLLLLSVLAIGCGGPGSDLDRHAIPAGFNYVDPPDFEKDLIGLAIPDQGGAQAVFDMPLESTGLVGGITVSLKLTHTYVGDLLVYLEDPSGARVTLHNREGGATANIDKMFGLGGVAINQDAVLLHEVHGTWKVIVDDEAAQDTGTLQYVKLTILKV